MGRKRLQQGKLIAETVSVGENNHPTTAGPTDTVNDGGFHIEFKGMPVCQACSAHDGIAALLGKHGVHKFRCTYRDFGPAADAALLAREDGFEVTVVPGACPFQGV